MKFSSCLALATLIFLPANLAHLVGGLRHVAHVPLISVNEDLVSLGDSNSENQDIQT